ncbi:hypothetical protein B0G52_118147 [Cohnella sp. SGD-V74]|uniref:hypothetical protein n=1 Tax=unclassified Cohnella TaxID=2636738 RepID=UPI000D42D3DA|nr:MULTISPECIES: hypothetical protein [unclassified Cohnella]PRX65194.1 hypothetical protein B0G52_118147 [Cohnella sp. SGD-V74]
MGKLLTTVAVSVLVLSITFFAIGYKILPGVTPKGESIGTGIETLRVDPATGAVTATLP